MAKKKDIFLEQQRKNQIIFSTYKFLVEDSVANLTLDRIASACKISKGLVSYYFKNKDNLILETMTFMMGQEKQKLLSLAYLDQPVKSRVKSLIKSAIPSREEVENMAHFLMEVWSFAKNSKSSKTLLQESFKGIRMICKSIIDIGIDVGYFKKTDSNSMALILQSLFDGLMIQIAVDPTLDVDKVTQITFEFIDKYLSKG